MSRCGSRPADGEMVGSVPDTNRAAARWYPSTVASVLRSHDLDQAAGAAGA